MGNLYLYLYFCLHYYVFVLEGGVPSAATTTFRINHTFHLVLYSPANSDRQSWAPFLEPDHITQIDQIESKTKSSSRSWSAENWWVSWDETYGKTVPYLEAKLYNTRVQLCSSTVAQLSCIRVAPHNLVSAPKSCFNWHPGLFLTQVLMLQTVAGQ